MENLYGDGTAAPTIARVLATVPLEGLLIKAPISLAEKLPLGQFPEKP
jgi:NADPH-dependent ferric siderophore reductase